VLKSAHAGGKRSGRLAAQEYGGDGRVIQKTKGKISISRKKTGEGDRKKERGKDLTPRTLIPRRNRKKNRKKKRPECNGNNELGYRAHCGTATSYGWAVENSGTESRKLKRKGKCWEKGGKQRGRSPRRESPYTESFRAGEIQGE